MLSGHVAPSAGRLTFGGVDITDLAPHERARAGIARTYQVPRPFGQMTVLENLKVAAHFAASSRGTAATALIDEALAITGLTEHAGDLAGSLPLLTRKRHELARALAMRPKLLLIDEVAAGLTEEEVSDFIAIVRRIRSGGAAVVWIEHVIRTMVTATDRLMVLAGGEVLAIGDPKAVIATAGGETCLPRRLIVNRSCTSPRSTRITASWRRCTGSPSRARRRRRAGDHRRQWRRQVDAAALHRRLDGQRRLDLAEGRDQLRRPSAGSGRPC